VAAPVTEGRPDVVLMDWNMPVMTGTTVTRDLVANHPTYRGG
jgi:CheY-like chemotaxis protein